MNGISMWLSDIDSLFRFVSETRYDKLAILFGAALLGVAAIGKIKTWVDLDNGRRKWTGGLGLAFMTVGLAAATLQTFRVVRAKLYAPPGPVQGLASGGCPVKVPFGVMVVTNARGSVGYEIIAGDSGGKSHGTIREVDSVADIPVQVEFGDYHGPVELRIVSPANSTNVKDRTQIDVNCGNTPLRDVDVIRDFESGAIRKEAYGDNRGTDPQGREGIQALVSVGGMSIVNGSRANSGPTYQIPRGNGFPYIQADREQNLVILHPGTGDTSHLGASLALDLREDKSYAITGAFRRANDLVGEGDGVDAAIILDTDASHPLWAEHIGQNDTTEHRFSLTNEMRRGRTLRFIVFSGPEGRDGTFDATSLTAIIK